MPYPELFADADAIDRVLRVNVQGHDAFGEGCPDPMRPAKHPVTNALEVHAGKIGN